MHPFIFSPVPCGLWHQEEHYLVDTEQRSRTCRMEPLQPENNSEHLDKLHPKNYTCGWSIPLCAFYIPSRVRAITSGDNSKGVPG